MSRRVAVITGGARGIGRAVALRLAADGKHVWIGDIDPTGAKTVVDEITTAGGSAGAVLLDVSDPQSVTEAFDEIAQHDSAIDALVNNAGVTAVHAFEEIPVEAWERAYRVNVVGMYLCIRAALPALRHAPPPARIVNVASGAGKIAGAYTAAYHASKAAVISLTRSAAVALAPDILVNSVCPGVIDTPMWELIDAGLAAIDAPASARFDHRSSALPLQRPGTADEVAAVIAFLAGPESRYMTGEDVNVTGGSVMH